eukprot:snap_masked-scaffold_12-processed-gene-0.40-mRNA-1 protein AED:0.06 eAED:0.06 QI:0/0/0/1/1/1/2/0/564
METNIFDQKMLPENEMNDLISYIKGDKSLKQKLLSENYGKTTEIPSIIFDLEKKFIKHKMKMYSWNEIKKHNSVKDLWIVYGGYIFDITKFYKLHPGGRKVLTTMASRDCTDVFTQFHPQNTYFLLSKFLIGKLEAANTDQELSGFRVGTNQGMVSDFRKIRQLLLQKNLFETDMKVYYKKLVGWTLCFILAIYLVLYTKETYLHCISALLLAFFWQQLAYFEHDLGHNAVSHDRSFDHVVSATLGNLLGGIAVGWWKHSHNIHHINCNSINFDADIQHMPIMAVDSKMLNNFVSFFYEKVFVFDNMAKLLISYQHILFYPIMAIARFNLYAQSWILVCKVIIKTSLTEGIFSTNHDLTFKFTELFSLMGFILWWLMSYMDTTKAAVGYLLFSHALTGLLHVLICLSHFTMETYNGKFDEHLANSNNLKQYRDISSDSDTAYSGDYYDEMSVITENWLLLQVQTTLNLDNPVYLDFFYGGLNFQIEHHLLPRLPRHHLRLARRLIQELCKKHGVLHRDVGFIDANMEMLSRLKDTALKARDMDVTKGVTSSMESELFDGLNLVG